MRRSTRLEGVASSDTELAKTEAKAMTKLISSILKKDVIDRTTEELETLQNNPGIVTFLCKRSVNNKLVKEREQEVEDVASELEGKCKRLASIIEESRSLVIYTGAGISTAASIPDYRGPQGVWTLLKQGKECRTTDLSLAEPTYTHMAIAELYRKGYVKRVVSQNCDGLHLRSGLPRSALSELHGNMFLEVCRNCQPAREYLRLFDVTERTGMRRHKTGRFCHKCKSPLLDTIIHFGEKSPFQSPHNWQQATNAANKADVILCLGSSLKVLKKYACLWATHKPLDEQPRLVIVNLQWTPKDKKAELKINGRCDDVMKNLIKYLCVNVSPYDRHSDPIFHLSTSLLPHELNTTSKAILPLPDGFVRKSAEDLRVRTLRRKFVLKSASMQSEGDESISSYDEDSLASFMQSHYHVDEAQGEIRRQPVRLAKIKQFLVHGKRRSGEGSSGVPVKVSRHEESETSELGSLVTPSSSRSDLLDDYADLRRNEEQASQDLECSENKFDENSIDIRAELSTAEDTSESCYSIPQSALEGQTLNEELVSFSICSSMTPPPSNESIDSQSNDPLFNPLITFDCDYASVEEVISASDNHSSQADQKERRAEEVSLVTPGWFGKGVQMKKVKRKKPKKLKQ